MGKAMTWDAVLKKQYEFLKPYEKAVEKARKAFDKAKKKKDEAVRIFNIVRDSRHKKLCEKPLREFEEQEKALKEAEQVLEKAKKKWRRICGFLPPTQEELEEAYYGF